METGKSRIFPSPVLVIPDNFTQSKPILPILQSEQAHKALKYNALPAVSQQQYEQQKQVLYNIFNYFCINQQPEAVKVRLAQRVQL
jgi:hypothetical protein